MSTPLFIASGTTPYGAFTGSYWPKTSARMPEISVAVGQALLSSDANHIAAALLDIRAQEISGVFRGLMTSSMDPMPSGVFSYVWAVNGLTALSQSMRWNLDGSNQQIVTNSASVAWFGQHYFYTTSGTLSGRSNNIVFDVTGDYNNSIEIWNTKPAVNDSVAFIHFATSDTGFTGLHGGTVGIHIPNGLAIYMRDAYRVYFGTSDSHRQQIHESTGHFAPWDDRSNNQVRLDGRGTSFTQGQFPSSDGVLDIGENYWNRFGYGYFSASLSANKFLFAQGGIGSGSFASLGLGAVSSSVKGTWGIAISGTLQNMVAGNETLTASAGVSGALPGQVAGYLICQGSTGEIFKIPYFRN